MRKCKRHKTSDAVTAMTFDEVVGYGIANGGNVVGGMPWSFSINSVPISHENDDCYLINSPEGTMRFDRGDMLVVGATGELLPCKPDVFAASYSEIVGDPHVNMGFGDAVDHLKLGCRVARAGWNGKGMWLELQRPSDNSKMTLPYVFLNYPADAINTPGARVPWLASQTDMLAEDWMVVED